MRMSQFEAALCLTLELIKHGMILNHQVGKKFQRDIALQFFIACQPDNSHSASPKDLDQRVGIAESVTPTRADSCAKYRRTLVDRSWQQQRNFLKQGTDSSPGSTERRRSNH